MGAPVGAPIGFLHRIVHVLCRIYADMPAVSYARVGSLLPTMTRGYDPLAAM